MYLLKVKSESFDVLFFDQSSFYAGRKSTSLFNVEVEVFDHEISTSLQNDFDQFFSDQFVPYDFLEWSLVLEQQMAMTSQRYVKAVMQHFSIYHIVLAYPQTFEYCPTYQEILIVG